MASLLPKLDLPNAASVLFLSMTLGVVVTTTSSVLSPLLKHGKVARASSHTSVPIIEKLARLTVPKSWFLHYYVLFSALMWAQLGAKPAAVLAGSKYSLLWALLTVQATRRLIESLKVTKWSPKSTMHLSHYIVGISFYVAVAASSYAGLCKAVDSQPVFASGWAKRLVMVFLVALYMLCSVDQFQNHRHLASLVKYSAPHFRLFSVVSCAHYLDEIVIYLVVMVVALSAGPKPLTAEDWAFASGWIFAVVNLSVSAVQCRRFYLAKFDDYHVKYAIMPYLY